MVDIVPYLVKKIFVPYVLNVIVEKLTNFYHAFEANSLNI